MFRRTIFAGAVSSLLMASPFLLSAAEIIELPLHNAAEKNDVSLITRLLADGADLDARSSDGKTPLLIATQANAIDAASILINAGADVNAIDNMRDSPYLYAGANGHLDILKLTLAHGADLTSVNRYGGTALIPAAERGHVETVRTLIDAGVDVDHVNRLHWTALLQAVILGDGSTRYREIVELLLNSGANANLADRDSVTALQHARTAGYSDIEKTLATAYTIGSNP